MYFLETIGEIIESAWVSGNAIAAFEGGHQFKDLPVLRRRGKQKEKDYKYTVNEQNNLENMQSLCEYCFKCCCFLLFLADTQKFTDCMESQCGRS